MTHIEETDPSLEALREQLRDVDRRFGDLLIERQKLAKKVAEHKIKHGVPLRHYTVEAKVIDRIAGRSESAGGKRQWGERLAHALIDCSLELQSTVLERRRAGGVRHVLVVGGLGKMGHWMCNFLDQQGHRVAIFDPGQGDTRFKRFENMEEGVEKADLILISSPLSQTPRVLNRIVDLKPKGVICDLASIKADLLPIFERAVAEGLNITSMHPLFGPSVTALHDRNIVICSLGNHEADAHASALFTETAANLITLDPKEHDRLMGLTLTMSHALNLLYARVLAKSGASFADLRAVASSTFNKQVKTTKEVAGENMEMYYEIQRLCDYKNIYGELSQEVNQLLANFEDDSKTDFLNTMNEAAEYFKK